jgi:methionyl aminopeptidase
VGLVKEPWEIAMMRHSGRRLAEVVALLRESVRPGVSTLELDTIAEKAIRDRGSIPSFKGYKVGPVTFHHTICASPNEQVVHGIPNDKPLVDGDVISIDVGLIYGGYHADSAFTVAIGKPSDKIRVLIDETERSLAFGAAQAIDGNRIGDIGNAIQRHVERLGFGVVREYVGHGIGRAMHEKPSVPNYGKARQGQLLKVGMCLAIEPMVTLGKHDTRVLRDGWTVVTADGSTAAHFEHTVVISPKGPEILTVLDGQNAVPRPQE